MRAAQLKENADNNADAAAALYVGCVMHARLNPIGHRFSHRMAAFNTGLASGKINDYTSPALSTPCQVLMQG